MAEPAGVVADARKSRETIAPRQCWVEGCTLPPVEVGPPTEIPMCWAHYDANRVADPTPWGVGAPSGDEPEEEPLKLPPLAEPFAAGTPLAPVLPEYGKPEPRKYPYPVIGNVPMEADFPRAELLWLVKRLERSEYERGQLKATNRRLLRRLRKLRHKRGRK